MFVAMILLIVQGLIFGFATDAVIRNKGYDENWFWWGFFFGLVALVVAVAKPDNTVTVSYEIRQQNHEKALLNENGWKCSQCGTVHPHYTGTCGCGNTKSASLEAEQKKQKQASELENLQKLKAYKELLDSGVITEEEFEKKKKELL